MIWNCLVERQLAIREYRPADAARLSEIYLGSRKATFSWLNTALFELSDFHRDTRGEHIRVAELSKTVIGFSGCWLAERFIHHLYLDPTHTGMGAGGALLDATVELVGQPVRLKCLTQNRRALRFYLSRGWNVVNGGKTENGQYYELELRTGALARSVGV